MNGSLNLIRKPHLELSSKANLSSSITGRALLFRVLPRRIAGPPRRIFYSRKGAKTQRNSGPLGLTSGGLGGYATLRPPRRIFFILAKPACRQTGRQAAKKSNRSLPLACLQQVGFSPACQRPLRLCVFASHSFFLSHADEADLNTKPY